MPSSRLSSQPTASTTIGVAVLGGILACTAWLMSPANAALPASGTASESAANVRPNRYGVPAKPWDANLGSHRAVVSVSEPAAAAKVHLEWRRRDPHPEAKTVIVANAKSDKPVANILLENVSSESGDVTFQPEGDSGEYYIYFLPGNPGTGAFPVAKYLARNHSASVELKAAAASAHSAKLLRWEARTEHDRFNEMEITATRAEHEAWLAQHAEPFSIFLEQAEHPVRMFDQPPQRWLQPRTDFTPAASVGDPLVFQLGLWATRTELRNVQVHFANLTHSNGRTLIPGNQLRCLQLSGPDKNRQVHVPRGAVGSLWCALASSPDEPGTYTGLAQISAEGVPTQNVTIVLQYSPRTDAKTAFEKPERLAKLLWLDSDIAQQGAIPKPFTPLRVEGQVIHCLGRSLSLDANGLPAHITSFFNGSVTKITPHGREILSAPMRFVASLSDGTEVTLAAKDFHFGKTGADEVTWIATLHGGGLSLALHGRMEFDGHVELRCKLSSTTKAELRNFRLEVPRTRDTTPYAMGLGLYGGATPASIDWRWDTKKHQDALWLGDVNAGLRIQWRAENYRRPMVNIHYPHQPLNDPPSWSGGGEGGIQLTPSDGHSILTAHSGQRILEPDKPLHFDFDLSITPFKPLNTEAQWRDRYAHVGGDPAAPEKIRESGANVINIHQGNSFNPYINYPFLTADKLASYTHAAHAEGLRVKQYYTVRELTNWAPELFALRAFGDELLAPGKGGGHAWCEEHLGGDYLGAWYSGTTNDASVLTTTMSRFHNFYLEGLDWLVKHTGCDGIYLDDISYDRTVMKRARRILDTNPRGGLIDLHSWNEMNARAGFASCSLIFMDSFPYVDRLWLGEGHHYDGPAAQTLVGVSGIPFGLMGEMLEGGGNPWLGITFGMTGRLGWGGDPQPVWKLWDAFGAAGSEFIGWWDKANPVKAGAPGCQATIWKKDKQTLVAIANFSDKAVKTTLAVDFAALGLDPKKAHLYAPEMKGFQPELLLAVDAPVPIAPKRGFVFILDEIVRPPVKAAPALTFETAKLLFEDHFVPQPKDGWTVTASPAAGGIKADEAGLVFSAPANAHLWQEWRIPSEITQVSAQIRQDAGDTALEYGPGLALVWPDGKLLKASRRRDNRITISGGGINQLAGVTDIHLPVTLSFVFSKDAIRIVASGEGAYEQQQELASIPRSAFVGNPTGLRLGKIPNNGKPTDQKQLGLMGWNRVDWVKVYRE